MVVGFLFLIFGIFFHLIFFFVNFFFFGLLLMLFYSKGGKANPGTAGQAKGTVKHYNQMSIFIHI